MRMRGLAAGKEKMDAFWRCMEFLRSTPQKVFRIRRRSRRTRGSLSMWLLHKNLLLLLLLLFKIN